MRLPTLVVCEGPETRRAQIEQLVQTHPDLQLLSIIGRQAAETGIEEAGPRLVWIDLMPEAQSGLELLRKLKERHPKLHYLVSNDTLEADLLKSAMQAGAIDFLDSQTWQSQLPDVIARVASKEIEHQQEQAKKEETLKQMQALKEQQEAQGARSDMAGVKSMRTQTAEMESRASANMILLAVLVILAVVAIAAFMMR